MTQSARSAFQRVPTLAWWTVAVLGVAVLAIPFFAGQAPLDLQVYLAGGHGVRSGAYLYGHDVRVRGYGFTYPPFAALLFEPLSLLPFGLAVGLAFVVSILCLAAVLRVVVDAVDLPLTPTLPMLAAALAAVFCEPVRVTVWNGQINLVLLALLAVDYALPTSSRWRGVATGVAAAVKLTPALFVLLLLLQRDWRATARAVGSAAVCTGIAAVVLPTTSKRFWLTELFNKDNIGDTSRDGNQSLYAVAQRAFGTESAARAAWAVSAVVVLALGGVVVHHLLREGNRLLAWSVTGIVACLVSPVSWTHHWIWCVPLLVALWPTLSPTRGGRLGLAALALLFVVGCNKPPLSLAYHYSNPVGEVFVENGYVWAGVALLAWLLWRTSGGRWTRRRARDGDH